MNTLDPDVTRWACEHLGLPENATKSEVRQGCLAGLAQLNYVPSEEWREPIRALRHGERGRRDHLRIQVECFALRYFQMVPAERRRLHEELSVRCEAVPRLKRWLERLGRGLDVPGIPEVPEVRHLAHEIVEVFRSLPRERRSLLHKLKSSTDTGALRIAVEGLLKDHPAFASMDPEVERWLRRQQPHENKPLNPRLLFSERVERNSLWFTRIWTFCLMVVVFVSLFAMTYCLVEWLVLRIFR